jgi:hypothetical protein
MKAQGKFILMEPDEFKEWLGMQPVTRKIKLVQLHHTWSPSYKDFNGNNHFDLCLAMERSHLDRGFAEIAQNLTTFPDGTIMSCRELNRIPAGIKGANTYGICIENLGNFDTGKDKMTALQRNTIISVTKSLLFRFGLTPSEKSVVYHHWYDLTLGTRIREEGTGETKTCPGTAFFGGNTVQDYDANLKPLL